MYIYSTASADQKFNVFKKMEKGGVPQVAGHVIINGKANLANKNLITAKGVVTQITDSEYDMLKDITAFSMMVKEGFLVVESKKLDPEKVAKDMTAKDKAAPLTNKEAEKAGVKVHSGEDVVA